MSEIVSLEIDCPHLYVYISPKIKYFCEEKNVVVTLGECRECQKNIERNSNESDPDISVASIIMHAGEELKIRRDCDLKPHQKEIHGEREVAR